MGIPTEPIGSIPRPTHLLEATGAPVITDGEHLGRSRGVPPSVAKISGVVGSITRPPTKYTTRTMATATGLWGRSSEVLRPSQWRS